MIGFRARTNVRLWELATIPGGDAEWRLSPGAGNRAGARATSSKG
jgi:general stress protein 26